MNATIKMQKHDEAGNIIKMADVHPLNVKEYQVAGWVFVPIKTPAPAPQKVTPSALAPASPAPAKKAPAKRARN